MTRVTLVFVLVLAACSSGGNQMASSDAGTGTGGRGGGGGSGGGGGLATGGGSGSSGASGGAGTGGQAGTPGDGGADDQTLCTDVCAAFASCGVTIKSNCASACVAASATYKTCLRAAGNDCNGLAMCYFKATASTNCPGGGGLPSRTATCAATDSCQGTCNTNSSGASCTCACVAALSPSVAIQLLAVNSCALDLCSSECGAAPPGPACNTCFQSDCAAPRTACLSH